jgi:hypothetical protein
LGSIRERVKDCSKQGKEMDIRDIHIGDEVVFTCKCQDLETARGKAVKGFNQMMEEIIKKITK